VSNDRKEVSQPINSPVDYTLFVRKLVIIDYVLLGLQLGAYGFFAGVFVNIFIAASGLPYSLISANPIAFWSICLIFPALLLSVLLYRNRFFLKKINEKTAGNFIYFAHWWRRAIPLFTAFLMCYYTFVALTQDFRFIAIPFACLFFMISLFEVLDKPLTDDGETYVLIESIIRNGNNFKKVQFFWKKLTFRIEDLLKNGQYDVSHNDLLVYFNEKFFETSYDFSADLISIREWLMGNQRSCYEALTHIVPKNKIRQIHKTQTIFGRERAERKLLNKKTAKNWKIAFEITGFIASIATIITLFLMFT
jgi:hypothetical protein